MGKMKQILGFFLALVILLDFSTKVSAGSITIVDESNGGSYVAYQLMSVTSATDAEWDVTYAYTVNTKYSGVLQQATGQSTDEGVLSYISGISDSPSVVTAFANSVYRLILSENLEADATSSDNAFNNLNPGYYLIAETPDSVSSSNNQEYSLVMLTTVSEEEPNITAYVKESVPTLVKKVKESNDSDWDLSLLNSAYADSTSDGWQDGADYDIGESVPFRLTASISNNYDSYAEYRLSFHDTLSSGLTFESDSVKVFIDGTELNASYYGITDNTLSEGGGSFSVEIMDLKALSGYLTISVDSSVVVEYTAILNANANVGSAGNDNKAYLEYSNNPYGSGTGTTPEDVVRVFTFELQVDKVDSKEMELAGAGFQLYKEIAGEDESRWVEVGEEQVGTENAPLSQFSWIGLDSGNYKLVEMTVPDGYTKADDIFFSVESDYHTRSDNPLLTELSVTVTEGSGSVNNNTVTISLGLIRLWVTNISGDKMPSTGGTGTTRIYLFGGLLVLGAIFLLTMSRREKRN